MNDEEMGKTDAEQREAHIRRTLGITEDPHASVDERMSADAYEADYERRMAREAKLHDRYVGDPETMPVDLPEDER